MGWFFGFAAAAVVVLGIVVAQGRLGGMPEEPVRDVFQPDLPDGPLGSADLDRVQFSVVPRGYAMSEVDDLLDRLRRELRDRERRESEREDPPDGAGEIDRPGETPPGPGDRE